MPTTDPQIIDIKKTSINSFAPRLLTWFDDYGRHDLPWQQHKTNLPDAYKVWISEVMLQQTQVVTVIPYYKRFMQSFPTVNELANAKWDTVAEHWAGLGYYARARNLHKGAKQLVDIINQTGHYPQTVAEWEQISGVGRSTAGAIVAMGLHDYGVICDGNVKRVLTRWAGIEDDITKAATTKQLWALAETLTPKDASGNFAQAMMDMGATVCNRTKPACLTGDKPCPIQADCIAFKQNKQLNLPFKAKKKPKPSKHSYALVINNPQGKSLWLKRPETGIWGGLWCLPLKFIHKLQGKKIVEDGNSDASYEKELTTAEQIIDQFLQNNTIHIKADTQTKQLKYTLTHFHWHITTCHINLNQQQQNELNKLLADAHISFYWLDVAQAQKQLALPAVINKIFS